VLKKKDDSKLYKFVKFFYDRIVFCMLIRFMIEGYMELTLMTLLNLYNRQFTFNGDIAASWFSIFFCVSLAIVPVGLVVFVYKLGDKFKDPNFSGKYGSVYADLNMENNLSRWYNVIFVYRRLFITISAIFLGDFLFLQFLLVAYGTLASLTFSLHVKPFEDVRMNRIEVLNDLTILFSIYFLYLFNTPNPEAKFNYGWALVAMNLGNVIFNLGFAFSIQIRGYIKSCKNYGRKKGWIKYTRKPRQDLCDY